MSASLRLMSNDKFQHLINGIFCWNLKNQNNDQINFIKRHLRKTCMHKMSGQLCESTLYYVSLGDFMAKFYYKCFSIREISVQPNFYFVTTDLQI